MKARISINIHQFLKENRLIGFFRLLLSSMEVDASDGDMEVDTSNRGMMDPSSSTSLFTTDTITNVDGRNFEVGTILSPFMVVNVGNRGTLQRHLFTLV